MKFYSKPLSLFLTIVLSALSSVGNAQALKQYIPSSATVVLGVNWKSLENKLAFSQFSQDKQELIDDNVFMTLFMKILENPNDFGVDLKEQTYYFQDMGDTFSNQVMLIALSNRTNFMDKALEWLRVNNPDAAFKKVSGKQQYAYGNLVVSCSNDLAIILLGKKNYFNSYNSYHSAEVTETDEEDFNYYSERRKVIHQIDSIRYSDNDPYAEEMESEYEYEEDVATEEAIEEAVAEDAYETVEEAQDYDEYEYDEATDAVGTVEEEYYDEYEESDYYDYDRHPLMKALNDKREEYEKKQREEFAKLQALKTLKQVEKYSQLKLKDTYAKNVKFNAVMNDAHDLSFWVNPDLPGIFYNKSMKRAIFGRQNHQSDTAEIPKETSFDRLMNNNFNYAFGDFNQGSINIEFNQERNKELQEFDYVNMDKINPKLLNYLGNETYGYWAANINVEDYFETYRKVMFALLESTNDSKNSTYLAAQFELMDIFLNKDIFYNTFSGDGIFAFTGLSTKIGEKYKYVYDEETFEQEYKMVSDTSLIPEILCMMTIGKQENVDRLLLGFEHMRLFRKVQTGVYEILDRPDGMPTSFYVAVNKGVLFVTNDADLVNNHLENGLPKSQQLSDDAKKLLMNYGNCMYWDSNKSFDAILEVAKDERPRNQGKIKVLQKHLSDGAVYMVEKNGVTQTNATLNFADGSINSLTELVNMLHEFHIIH